MSTTKPAAAKKQAAPKKATATATTASTPDTKTPSTPAPLDFVASAPVALGNTPGMDFVAKDLAKFIKDNKLTTTVQGKEFVNVEGWQYAGSRLGIVPIVEHVINVSNELELKCQAKVTLFDVRANRTVGAGFAVCSNKESGKKFYQEFAIMSMAQTRAIGKAYRNCLAWMIRAAGYEPTPAEEMDYNTSTPATTAAPVPRVEATVVPDNFHAEPVPVMQVVPATPVPAGAVPPTQYATASQKEEIIRLLNHPLIARSEKTKMLLNINRLDEERAIQAIAKLRKAIDDREQGEKLAPTSSRVPALRDDEDGDGYGSR